MCQTNNHVPEPELDSVVTPRKHVKLKIFFMTLWFYVLFVFFCMTPWFFPTWQSHTMNDDDNNNNNDSTKEWLAQSLVDMAWCSFFLVGTILYASMQSYQSEEWSNDNDETAAAVPSIIPNITTTNITNNSISSLYHDDGTPKSKEELEQEALEEPCSSFLSRFLLRPAFKVELVSFLLGMLSILKCLIRLQYEIYTLDEEERYHPLFWLSCLISAIFATMVGFGFESMVSFPLSVIGTRQRQQQRQTQSHSNHGEDVSMESSSFLEPLLPSEQQHSSSDASVTHDNVVLSDIRGDAQRKANVQDLIQVCSPDFPYFVLAFVFLLLAALAQVLIPRYTGNMLDAIAQYAINQPSNDNHHDDGIWNIPEFWINMKKLVMASILGGLFSGIRGSIFTVVGGRVNVRLRTMLMDSLLAQDIGFFDVTKTGDITSRLSSDTTLVGDQVTLNVNVFLRSFVQAIGVLVFMTMLSWQLTLLAFISVPVITIFSKWYGHYIRRLTKLMQKKLADGNGISEAALGSMSTVRALGTYILRVYICT